MLIGDWFHDKCIDLWCDSEPEMKELYRLQERTKQLDKFAA